MGDDSQLRGARVLVTGGTGFTGSYVLRELVARGAEVRAIARPSSSIALFEGLPIAWYRGDVYDAQLIAEAATDVDYIFHIAAAFRQAKIADSEYRRVHVESTQLLARHVVSSKRFKRLVHVSTMGVHGHIENPPGSEDSPYAPGDEYQRTKLEAEDWLRGFAAESNLPYTILRPTGIFGPGDRRLLKVFKMAAMPLYPILGNGKCLYHLIHVEDLRDAILHAATHANALGEAFLIGNETAIPLEDIVGTVSEVIGTTPKAIRLPAGPFFGLAAICEAICKPLGIEPPIYRRRVAFFTKDRSFSTRKAREVLQFTPRYSNREGIIQTAKWYVAQGWLASRNDGSLRTAEKVR